MAAQAPMLDLLQNCQIWPDLDEANPSLVTIERREEGSTQGQKHNAPDDERGEMLAANSQDIDGPGIWLRILSPRRKLKMN